MKTSKRFIFLMILLIIALAFPSTALASKRVFRARLTTGAELHEVIDSNASGSLIMASFPDGTMRVGFSIRNLSGAPTGVHLHGPATEDETAPVLLTLCGSPAPAAVTTCPFEDGYSVLSTSITSSLLAQWNLLPRDFQNWLAEGKIYVNVHTQLNPMGETRGQLIEQ